VTVRSKRKKLTHYPEMPGLDKVPDSDKSSGDSAIKQYSEVTMPAQVAVFCLQRYRILLATCLTLLIVSPAVAVSSSRGEQDSSALQRSGASQVAILLVQADMDCTFRLDDQPGVSLKAFDPTKVQTGLGEHLLTAVSLDGQDHWTQVVQLAQPGQKVVLIELLNVKAARQSAKREAAQSQPPQQTGSNEQKAAEATEATNEQAAQQDAVKPMRRSPASVPVSQPGGVRRFAVLHAATHASSGLIIIANGMIKFSPSDGDNNSAFEFPVGKVKEVQNSWADGTDAFHIRFQNGKSYRFIPCKPSDSGYSGGWPYKDVIPGDGAQMAADIRAALANP
jgi:hypothetical protein